MQKERKSEYELLRIVAQVMIVYYHIMLFVVYPLSDDALYKAIWLPLHTGVPLFVFISGYFGIKPSVKGFVKLLGMVFVLQFSQVLVNLQTLGGVKIDEVIFFVSRSPFWFIRTYIYLYLLSPIINKFLFGITIRKRFFLLVVLFFISDYIGTIGTDKSLSEGYNIITFFLFYTVGDTIREYKSKWSVISKRKWLLLFLIVNVSLIVAFSLVGFDNKYINSAYNWLFFGYNSPGLLLSSILLFIYFGCVELKSKMINSMAKTSLAIYILHLSIFPVLIKPAAEWVYNYNGNMFLVVINILLLTIVVVAVCMCIYWILTPIWKVLDRIAMGTQILINQKVNQLLN